MAAELFISDYQTPYGLLRLGDYEGQLCHCDWVYRSKDDQLFQNTVRHLGASIKEDPSALHQKAITLNEAALRIVLLIKRF